MQDTDMMERLKKQASKKKVDKIEKGEMVNVDTIKVNEEKVSGKMDTRPKLIGMRANKEKMASNKTMSNKNINEGTKINKFDLQVIYKSFL